MSNRTLKVASETYAAISVYKKIFQKSMDAQAKGHIPTRIAATMDVTMEKGR